MTTFKIEIQENGVSVLESEMLYDAQGNPVPQPGNRKAIGIGDFPDTATYQTRVKQMLEGIYGTNLASLVSENAMVKNHRNQLQSELTQVKAQRDQLDTLKDQLEVQKATLEAEKAQLQAENAALRAQIPANPSGQGGNPNA